MPNFSNDCKAKSFFSLAIDSEEGFKRVVITDSSGKDILINRASSDEVEGLEDHADIPSGKAKLLAFEPLNIDTVDEDLAVLDVMHLVDAADESGFARAGKTDDGDKLTVFHVEVDIRQGLIAVRIDLIDMNHF